jgi:cephalosporin hydroxylase
MVSRLAYLGKSILQSVRTPKQADIIDKFNYLYFHGTAGVKPYTTVTWMGIKTLKCPPDLFVYQEIIQSTRPDVVVECGVMYGGTTLYLANLMDLLGGEGQVIACDIDLSRVDSRVREHPRISLIEGSSTAPEVVSSIRETCNGKKTMVILDSDHHEPHVRAELAAYSRMVSSGCYLICEDTNINGHPADPGFGPGPWEAVQAFLGEHHEFQVDRNAERLLLTFNPSGYLKRR